MTAAIFHYGDVHPKIGPASITHTLSVASQLDMENVGKGHLLIISRINQSHNFHHVDLKRALLCTNQLNL